ncbi:MAG: tetratricopeptide repeat protein [Candidatus Thorarchaeota archaeon]
MYERFEPAERIFVDREEHLEWMNNALKRCKEKSVVLHIKGIGGIGKSSLLDHWTATIQCTIRLDCEQHSEFYDRLNILAKGVVLQGVNLQRFDVLWQIRQRFVEGVEPVREEGRQWAKDVFMAIPFIGTLTSIGSAINAISSKVTPKLKGKFGTIGKWLQDRLGKNHVEKLLEILWKEPYHAQFLYLDALLEDINGRTNINSPLLFLMDHFEYVDNEKTNWRYEGRQITETELWNVFLCSISNSVGVMASRKAVVEQLKDKVEEYELLELDAESSSEFIRLRRITDENLQAKIVTVSGGNPFVIGTICDLVDTGDIELGDIEGLGAETLEEVRIKTWRRLFNEAHDLTAFIDRAGLLPFFNRRVMNIISPDMKAEQWDRMIRLSFVRNIGNQTYVLHDLAEWLIVAELGDRLAQLCDDVATRLDEASKRESDLRLLGLAISAIGKADPRQAINKLGYDFAVQVSTVASATVTEFMDMLDIVRLNDKEGKLHIQDWQGYCLYELGRYAECEHLLKDTLKAAQILIEDKPEYYPRFVARVWYHLAGFYARLGRGQEAEEAYKESISILSELHRTSVLQEESVGGMPILLIWMIHWHYGIFLNDGNQPTKSEMILRRAYEYTKELPESGVWWNRQTGENLILSTLASVQISIGKPLESEATSRKIVEAPSFQQLDTFFKTTILGHLCRALRKTNRPYEAEAALTEARNTWKAVFEKDPTVEWISIANYTLVLGKIMIQTGRFFEAEKMFDEYRELTEKYASDEYQYVKALAHSHYGVLHTERGMLEEALTAHETSLKILRSFVEKSPKIHRAYVADSLNNYAIALRKMGKLKEAIKSYREALEISRELMKESPENVESQNRVGSVLANYGILLSHTNKLNEAEKLLKEAFEIRKKLVEVAPEMFEKHLAWTLANLGTLYLKMGNDSDSLTYFNDALELLKRLSENTRDLFYPNIVVVLNNLGFLYRQSGDMNKSDGVKTELEKIREVLVKKDARVYQNRFTLDEIEDLEEFLIDL